MPSLAVVVLAAVVATLVVWWGTTFLDEASDRLADLHDLPPVVQGAVVTAVASSFPELASSVLSAALHGSLDLGVSAVLGSAIFNVLVIPAAAALSGDGLEADRSIVHKEGLFYMLSITVLVLIFGLAALYRPAPGAGSRVGVVTWPLALVPMALYGLYIFLQTEDAHDHEPAEADDVDASPWRVWLKLGTGLLIVLAGVEVLLRTAIALGEILDTPSFLWGLTVVAVATSLPDLIVSVRTARRGEDVTSLGNVLGSNVFDLLVAIPAGILVAGLATVDLGVSLPVSAVLVLSTVLLVTLLRTELRLSRREAGVLTGAYGVFLGLVVAEALGWTHLLPATG